MHASNPYAPPRASVDDITDPYAAVTMADRATRLAAAILDGIIFFVMVYMPLVITLGAAGALSAGSPDPAGVDRAVAIGGLLATIGFVVWCVFTIRYMQANGQSIAKKLVGIKVVRADGSRASLARLIWMRNVLNWALSMVPLYGVVDVLFIFGESRQCLHDKLADTIVVNA